jgi:hypothetical protein
MIKRIVAVPLWFVAGWMIAAMGAFVFGLPSWLVPLTAVSVAAFVGVDPAGWIWARAGTASASATARSALGEAS